MQILARTTTSVDAEAPCGKRSRSRGASRPSFAWSRHPRSQEGAGKAGRRLAPAVCRAKSTRGKNRTAAYRCSRTLGLPCAMVGRLMPCSPRSRVRSGLRHLCGSHRQRAGWRDCRIRQGLTVATTARTTRFCRTHGPPFRRSFSSPVDGAGNLQARRTLQCRSSARDLRARRDTPTCPRPLAPDTAASTASPARENNDHMIAPQE